VKKIVPLIAALLIITSSSAFCGVDSDLANIFKRKAITGTIVISSLDGTKTYIHDDERANTRMIPASTFKIPNTLIALEEGAVVDEKEIIKWDGVDKGMQGWNKDQSIETAFPSSCVWFYQELAKRVGKEKYESYLRKMGYGNELAGPEVTTFWLQGDLKISANEQITFLKRLYAKEYPFKPSSYEVLKKVMVVEETPAYTLRAKTGWAQKVGWFVGYVESGHDTWFFATNIDMAKIEDAPLRKEITVEALKIKGII
jgi:beta-lactamase class D